MTQTEFEQMLLQARPKMMGVAVRFFRNREDAEELQAHFRLNSAHSNCQATCKDNGSATSSQIG